MQSALKGPQASHVGFSGSEAQSRDLDLAEPACKFASGVSAIPAAEHLNCSHELPNNSQQHTVCSGRRKASFLLPEMPGHGPPEPGETRHAALDAASTSCHLRKKSFYR